MNQRFIHEFLRGRCNKKLRPAGVMAQRGRGEREGRERVDSLMNLKSIPENPNFETIIFLPGFFV
jgi:hypothetical protein